MTAALQGACHAGGHGRSGLKLSGNEASSDLQAPRLRNLQAMQERHAARVRESPGLPSHPCRPQETAQPSTATRFTLDIGRAHFSVLSRARLEQIFNIYLAQPSAAAYLLMLDNADNICGAAAQPALQLLPGSLKPGGQACQQVWQQHAQHNVEGGVASPAEHT